MRINHNISAMITQVAMRGREHELKTSLERLSTGLRINKASDDAAGLSVSEQLRTQVNGLNQNRANINDGISLLNVAEGALNEISSMLQRMRELAIQSSNDTLTTTERNYIDQEFQHMIDEIDRTTEVSQYNTQTLLDGDSAANSFGATGSASSVLHVGPNAGAADELTISITGTSSGALGITGSALTNHNASVAAINSVDVAIHSINAIRSDIGAFVNRMQHALNNVENQWHNMQSAEAVIRDVDFASETTAFTRAQILMQSATAMLSQANSVPQTVLSLLQ